MNIAQRYIEYYEHKDFKSNYIEFMLEDFHNNKGDLYSQIRQFIQNYEFEKTFGFNKYVSDIKPIYDLLNSKLQEIDLDDVVDDFSGYYVGYTCLCSSSYGEQEDQLSGIINHKTGKPYSKYYLRKVFEDAGYSVNGDSAYYIPSGGVMIDFIKLVSHEDVKEEFLQLVNNAS